MSLIAWYPLNGDVDDYSGYNNILNVSGTNTLIDAGKIGQTYTKSSGYYETNINAIPENLSIAMWFKHNSSNWLSECLFGTRLSGDGFMLYRNDGDADGYYRIYFWYVNTSAAVVAYYPYPGLSGFAADTWYHLVMTRYADGSLKFFRNGAEIYSETPPADFVEWHDNGANLTFHGQGNGSAYTSGDYNFNDIRVYDNILSEKEIQELAKAKVLHYSFNDFQEPTTNLTNNPLDLTISPWVGSSITVASDSVGFFKLSEVAVTNAHYLYQPFTTIAGETYTFSAIVKKNGRQYIAISFSSYGNWTGGQGGHTYFDLDNGIVYSSTALDKGITKISSETYKIWITATSTAVVSSNVNIFMYLSNSFGSYLGDVTKGLYVKKPQLETKPYYTPFVNGSRTGTVRDASGYGNDAVLVEANTPEWIEANKMGSGAYDFGLDVSDDKYIQCNVFNNPSNQITINMWLHSKDVGNYSRGFASKADTTSGANGWSWRTGWGDDVRFNVGGNTEVPVYAGVDNNLCMITGTYDSTTGVLKWYKNGVIVQTRNLTPAAIGNSSNPLYVGHSTGTGYFKGNIEDFRIYATALSVDDILELYQTRAQLDNTGNFSVNEISESSSILLVESQQKNVINSAAFGTVTVLNPDLTSFVESDDTLGNFRIEGWVYVSDTTYYPTRFEYTIENNTKGFITTTDTVSGSWVLGWNKILMTSVTYADAANTPWYDMTRLEIYKSGPTTGADTSQYVIFKDLRLVKNIDNSVIQTNLSDGGVYKTREVSEVGITDGIQGFWKLNGDAKDYSGNGNDGTIVGATQTSGLKNGAYLFNGSSDYINCGSSSSLSITKTVSVFAWIRLDNVSGWNGIFGAFSGSEFIHFQVIDDNLTSYIYGANAGGQTTDSNLVINTWYHVGITFDGNTLRFFKNGEESATTYTAANPNTDIGSTSDISIGRVFSVDRYFGGKIADTRIYDRALSSEEINILYKYGLPSTGMQLGENGTVYTNKEIIETL